MAKKIKITKEELIELKNEKKSSSRTMMIMAICFLVTINVVLLIALIIVYNKSGNEINELSIENDSLRSEINNYKKDSEQLNELLGDKTFYYIKNKLELFDDSIVFQIEGKGKYYYSYDCMQKIVDGEYSYWAYNLEQAKGNGLKKGSCK